ncbi:MAG TPA: glycoside hydrolase family 31 protein [Candidatus Binataceae bacterium]|nr:glycoside hydrolase family 31 protein [Candidatus Binataceae bacterium]
MPITVGNLGRLGAVDQRGKDIVFSFESSDLVLTPLLPNLVRHTWVPKHWRLYTERVNGTYAARRYLWPAAERAAIVETSQSVQVRCGELLIEATRDPFHLRYSTTAGETFLEEAIEGGLSWSYWDYALRFRLAPEDHFYGMGQVNQLDEPVDLDHRGHRREVWNQHSPPATTILPALHSLRGYGLLVDNPRRATWDLGHGDPAAFSYQSGGGGLQYYVFYGPDLPRLLRTYLELTGYPPMPPRWVLGLLQSRYGYRNRNELELIARTFREKRLPCDALILDVYWFRDMGDLAFDPVDWPDAPEMIARLRQQGYRIMLIEEPYVAVRSRNYHEASSKGYLARRYDGSPYTFDFWPGECALVDFSNPAAREWWTALHRPLLEMGVAGWWSDLNEPAKHYQDMLHHAGSAPMVHNLAAFEMHRSIFEAAQRYTPRQRTFILSRSAFAGSQRYGASLWSGDVDMTFAALRKQVAVGLNTSLAGFPLWGSDIGGFGFEGKCSPELYVRWYQFGAFCPLCRPHGDQTELREPWQFGPEIEAICRKYLSLRYRLLPYTYTALHQACASGIPLMRALVVEFPRDPEVLNISDEYIFGSEILVAPVMDEGAAQRKVYLPAGRWVDFWTEAAHSGPKWLDVSAPLDTLPLFVREGAIIPSGPEVQSTADYVLDPLTIEVYRGADRSFILYEDDGETFSYQNGAWAETPIEVMETAGILTCVVGEARGDYAPAKGGRAVVINVHRQPPVHDVSCGTVEVDRAANAESIERVQAGWWWDEGRKLLTIKLRRKAEPLIVRVA